MTYHAKRTERFRRKEIGGDWAGHLRPGSKEMRARIGVQSWQNIPADDDSFGTCLCAVPFVHDPDGAGGALSVLQLCEAIHIQRGDEPVVAIRCGLSSMERELSRVQ